MDRYHRLNSKLDTITEKISEIDVTLAAQHVTLKEHMRRTELLEKSLKPVQRHVDMVNGVLKFIGLLALFAAIYEAVK